MLWKEVAGKTITAAQARELLGKGETAKPVKGFTSKAGKTFDARLRLDRETGRVAFVFDAPAPAKPAASPKEPRIIKGPCLTSDVGCEMLASGC